MNNIDNLTNEELDRLCAEAMGVQLEESWETIDCDTRTVSRGTNYYTPTTNKAQAMELLEEFKVELAAGYSFNEDAESCDYTGSWEAEVHTEQGWIRRYAPTPALAICRSVAAMQLSKE